TSRRCRGKWRLQRVASLHSLENRIIDERRVAAAGKYHGIAGIEKHVQIGGLLRKRHERWSLRGGDFHQQPIAIALLPYDLAFDPFARAVDRLRQIRAEKGGALHGNAQAQHNTDYQSATQDHPASQRAPPRRRSLRASWIEVRDHRVATTLREDFF